MGLQKPYRIHRQMHLGHFLDELERRGLLQWRWDYNDENSRALFLIAEPGNQCRRYYTRDAEKLAARIAESEDIVWLPVPSPGGKDQYDETIAKIDVLMRPKL